MESARTPKTGEIGLRSNQTKTARAGHRMANRSAVSARRLSERRADLGRGESPEHRKVFGKRSERLRPIGARFRKEPKIEAIVGHRMRLSEDCRKVVRRVEAT